MPLNNLTFHHFGVRLVDRALCLVFCRAIGSPSSGEGRTLELLEWNEARRCSHGFFFCEWTDDVRRVRVGVCDEVFITVSERVAILEGEVLVAGAFETRIGWW
jgi:hypothetical protein